MLVDSLRRSGWWWWSAPSGSVQHSSGLRAFLAVWQSPWCAWWCCILLWVWGQPRRKATSISISIAISRITLARVQCTFSPPAYSGHKSSNIPRYRKMTTFQSNIHTTLPLLTVASLQSRQYYANNGPFNMEFRILQTSKQHGGI